MSDGKKDLVHKTEGELPYLIGKFAGLPKPLILSLGWLTVAALALVLVTCLVVVFAIIDGKTVELGWLGRFGVSSTTEAGGLVNSPTTTVQLEQRKYLVEMLLRNDPELDKDLATINQCFLDWSSSGPESSTISIEERQQRFLQAKIKHCSLP